MTGRDPVELHPEHRDPLVRVTLTPRVVDAAGWVEVFPFMLAWCAAGAAYLEADGTVVTVAQLGELTDVADVYGCRLVFVDEDLAATALEVLQPARAEGRL